MGVAAGLSALALLAMAMAGCVTEIRDVPVMPPRGAAVAVTNLTPYRWRVTFRAVKDEGAGAVLAEAEVAPRGVAEVTLASGGEVVIEQAVVDAGSRGPRPRRFAMSFAAGERYEWALETLLTSGAAP